MEHPHGGKQLLEVVSGWTYEKAILIDYIILVMTVTFLEIPTDVLRSDEIITHRSLS